MNHQEHNGLPPGPGVFGRRYRLGSILGVDVGVDASWVFVAVLVTWSLAVGFFPVKYPHSRAVTYWLMGAGGALGLFISILLHELSHCMMARRHGVELRGITLFMFGGVAHMGDEPPTPKAEFLVAIAGPIASIIVAAVCYGLGRFGGAVAPPSVAAVLLYLGYINALLVAFNLLPAFPLDGGRVLRAILWNARQDLRWATRLTAKIGAGFGLGFIGLGIVSFMAGAFVGGMWWALIGLFLRHAAGMSYRQVVMRDALQGEPVRRFMHTEPRTVRSDTSLRSLDGAARRASS